MGHTLLITSQAPFLPTHLSNITMIFAAVRSRIVRNPLLRRVGLRLCEYGRDFPRRVRFQKVPLLQRWSGRPIGLHRTAAEYLAAYPARGWEKVIRAGGSYERVPAIALAPPLPPRFNPPQTVAWKDERVIHLEGCRYWGEYGGAVITHDERLIGELSPDVWGVERHAIFNKIKLPALDTLPGLSAVISTPEANANYSHWLMDLMPRLNLLEAAGFGPEKVDRYLINMGNKPYELETLKLAGIPVEKLMPVSGASHFRCENIVTTNTRPEHWQHSLPAWVSKYLRELTGASSAKVGRPKRLYLTRNSSAFRRVLNEQDLHPILKNHGFENVDPGTLSLRDQAALFQDAEVIVSPHSSAMTNLVFCQPGIAVLELFPADYFDVSFWTAASQAKLRYHPLLGERAGAVPHTLIEGRRQDIIIPEATFRAHLETLMRNLGNVKLA